MKGEGCNCVNLICCASSSKVVKFFDISSNSWCALSVLACCPWKDQLMMNKIRTRIKTNFFSSNVSIKRQKKTINYHSRSIQSEIRCMSNIKSGFRRGYLNIVWIQIQTRYNIGTFSRIRVLVAGVNSRSETIPY
ncbi:hypothetical protein Hanom_Chr02g00167211 [Helianthus anomalus]